MYNRNVNDDVRAGFRRNSKKLPGFEKILDKKNDQIYTLTILKALMFLDFVGTTHRFHANRRDSVLNSSFKERERVNRLPFPQGNRLAGIQSLAGHRCPLEAERIGF
jgi:hypothetical protein